MAVLTGAPLQEIWVLRYRGMRIEKAFPSASAEQEFARSVQEVFAHFAEGIPEQHIVTTIEHGMPMMLAEHVDWDHGLVQPLHECITEHAEAQFQPRGEAVLQGLNDKIPFSIVNPRSIAFLEKYTYDLVTNIVAEQKQLVYNSILDAYKRGLGSYDAARLFRGKVGLTLRQERALSRFRDRMIERGVRPSVLERRYARYEARLHKYRADRIARTELNRAANAGEIEGWRQAADHDLIDRKKTQKHWMAYLDDRTCVDLCEAEDGQHVALDANFETTGVDHPPAHPNCRCTIYVDYVLKKPGRGTTTDGTAQWIDASNKPGVLRDFQHKGDAWHKGLPYDQQSIVDKWKGHGYHDVRNWMRGRPRSQYGVEFTAAEHADLCRTTERLLASQATAPTADGYMVFRGGALRPEAIRKLKEGQVLTQGTFASSSLDRAVARDFITKHINAENRVAVMWEVRNRTGRVIATTGRYGTEYETLLRPGQRYRVVSISGKEAVPGGYQTIVLEEMKTEASAESLLKKGVRIPWAEGAPAPTEGAAWDAIKMPASAPTI